MPKVVATDHTDECVFWFLADGEDLELWGSRCLALRLKRSMA
jgi:hypothetical protein